MAQDTQVAYKYFYESDSDEDVMPRAFPIDDDDVYQPQDLSTLPDTAEAYLKQVRWERKNVPKVVVANVDPRAFDAEQTMYLAQSAYSVEKSRPEMLPTKEWEEVFVKGFTRLHEDMEYSYLSHSASNKPSPECPPIKDPIKWSQYCFGKKKKVEKQTHQTQPTVTETPVKAEPMESTTQPPQDSVSEDGEIVEEVIEPEEEDNEEEPAPTVFPIEQDSMEVANESAIEHTTQEQTIEQEEEFEKPPHTPTMHILFSLDHVGIQIILKHHIAWMEKEKLTELRASWLFALLSRLERPLLDDTAANLSKLLRRLCFLRSKLEDPKDPMLPRLNILITIITKFFGQKE